MSIDVTPVAGALGGVVEGVDLRDPDMDFGAVYQAFLDYEVIFFPGANLTEDEQLALGRRFGTPSIYPVAKIMGATEPTMTVLTDGPDSPNAADEWHTDVTWIPTPPKAALLHSAVAAERGGDTLWASATKAYDTLSPAMADFVARLTAIHNTDRYLELVAEQAGDAAETLIEGIERDYPPVEHPLVRTHPETGKRALLYAKQFIEEIKNLTYAESKAVLDFIDEHVKEASLHCRWHWSEGDLAIWDERSTLHRSAADHWPQHRVIRRLEIDGDRPYFDPDAQVLSR